MHALDAHRRSALALLIAVTLALALLVPAAARGADPVQLSPKRGALLDLGSRPTFKVRDTTAAARGLKLFITISTSKKRNRRGDLKKTSIGSFRAMKRRRSIFSYRAEAYSFPTWFMAREGTYYWQAYRIDCAAARSCHVHTGVRSFRVR